MLGEEGPNLLDCLMGIGCRNLPRPRLESTRLGHLSHERIGGFWVKLPVLGDEFENAAGKLVLCGQAVETAIGRGRHC